MPIVAIERMNMRSRRIREFRVLLAILLGGYVVGLVLYTLGPSASETMAPRHFEMSRRLAVVSIMLAVFFQLLQWHVLRTLLLGFALLSLAYLFCAVVVMQFNSTLVHVVGLVALAVLFAVLFVTRSNLVIYLRDKTYADAAIEASLALGFGLAIGYMILRTLRGGP